MRQRRPTIETWSAGRPAQTAGELVRQAASRLAAPPTTVHVAALGDLPDRERLIRGGQIGLHNAPPDRDAYECLQHGDAVYLLGNSPRGVLHAAYAFEEQLAWQGEIPSGWRREGVFRVPLRFLHPRFDGWPGTRADIQAISREGATHALLTHDWHGSCRHLQGYAISPIFPDAVPADEVSRNAAGLRRLLDDCADHALECALWITELPCQGGPWVPEAERQAFLGRYPADVLSDTGTYEGLGLCFGHPGVRSYYGDLMRRFFAQFPEVGVLFVFGLDSGGRFCDPASCPHCRGMSLFDQRGRFLRFLHACAASARPGLRILTTTWGWEEIDRDACVTRQAELPPESGVYMAAGKDGWQAERQAHGFLRSMRRVCREKGQWFVGYDNFHWGDDSVHGLRDIQDYPLGIAAKMRRWFDLGADGVFDHWGGYSEDVACNGIALRAFFENPLADPEAICLAMAVRQFGREAGQHAFEAWQALERAHRILSNVCTWAPRQWPAWYQAWNVPPTLAALSKQVEDFTHAGDAHPLPEKEAFAFAYNRGAGGLLAQAVGEAWAAAGPHMADACARMREAVAAADDAPVGYAFTWKGEGSPPTRREHLGRQALYLEASATVGREIGVHFALLGLCHRTGTDPVRFEHEARPLYREDLDACRQVMAFAERAVAQGMTRTPGREPVPVARYAAKAAWLESHVAPKG